MRNLLALVGLVLVAFAGLGWYLDWYKIKTEPGANGHRNIDIDVNAPKISEDVKKGKEKLHDLVDKNTQSSSTTPGNSGPVLPGGSPSSVSFAPPPSSSLFPPSSTSTTSSSGTTVVLPTLEFPSPPSESLPKLPPPK